MAALKQIDNVTILQGNGDGWCGASLFGSEGEIYWGFYHL